MTDKIVTEAMLSCPFCGGEAELRDPHGAFSRLAAVFCDECEIRGPLASQSALAVAAWNTRSTAQESALDDDAEWLRAHAAAFRDERLPKGFWDGIVERFERIANRLQAKAPETDWQPIETFTKHEGKALIFDPRWGVAEGLRSANGRWGLAAFNGQVIEAHPTLWQTLPEPPETGEG